MFKFLSKFNHDECGAITVDLVVLTAVVSFIGIGVGLAFSSSATDLADRTGDFIADSTSYAD